MAGRRAGLFADADAGCRGAEDACSGRDAECLISNFEFRPRVADTALHT